jgi:hypothetical protein
MSVFSFLEWIFGGSFLDGFGASTNGDDEEGDGGTAGSGGPGEPPTSG